jgi:outer membrane lipase/esterase
MAADAATSVATMVNDLKTAGAESILVLNLPNLGLVPAAASNPAGATALSNAFNTTLSTALVGISGVELVDIFTVSTEIVANPALFRLDNVTDPCITTAYPDCSNHLFWDGAHPTTVGHALIADAALPHANLLMSIPLPATLPLMVSGLVGMTLFRRQRVLKNVHEIT